MELRRETEEEDVKVAGEPVPGDGLRGPRGLCGEEGRGDRSPAARWLRMCRQGSRAGLLGDFHIRDVPRAELTAPRPVLLLQLRAP